MAVSGLGGGFLSSGGEKGVHSSGGEGGVLSGGGESGVLSSGGQGGVLSPGLSSLETESRSFPLELGWRSRVLMVVFSRAEENGASSQVEEKVVSSRGW